MRSICGDVLDSLSGPNYEVRFLGFLKRIDRGQALTAGFFYIF